MLCLFISSSQNKLWNGVYHYFVSAFSKIFRRACYKKNSVIHIIYINYTESYQTYRLSLKNTQTASSTKPLSDLFSLPHQRLMVDPIAESNSHYASEFSLKSRRIMLLKQMKDTSVDISIHEYIHLYVNIHVKIRFGRRAGE